MVTKPDIEESSGITAQKIVTKKYNSAQEILNDLYTVGMKTPPKKSTGFDSVKNIKGLQQFINQVISEYENKPPKFKNPHQENLFKIVESGEDTRPPEQQKLDLERLVQYNQTPGGASSKKIQKLREEGLEEDEALGLGIWVSHLYSLLNASIVGKPMKESDERIGQAASISAAKALKKLPGFTFEEMRKNAFIKYKDEHFYEDGMIVRGISLGADQYEEFLEPYKEALKTKTIYREPTLFAATGLKAHSFLSREIKYYIKPIADGTGQGRSVDAYKDHNYEDEVLFPPFSKFRVTKIEDSSDVPLDISEDVDFPEWTPQEEKYLPEFIKASFNKIKEEGIIEDEVMKEIRGFLDFYFNGLFGYGNNIEKFLAKTPPELKEKYGGGRTFMLQYDTFSKIDSFLDEVKFIKTYNPRDIKIYLEEVAENGK